MRVLVTGGASGLGAAIAHRYAKDGARVLVSDVDGEAGEKTVAALGDSAAFVKLDVTSDADWTAAREWCEREWDGLDVLVNNAGVAGGGRFERISMADWEWIMAINLTGVVRGCREFVPLFKRQGSGHLVNVASLAAIMNLPAMASYNVSKAAVLSLSETLRTELSPYGIGTTVVCPGFVRTNLGARMRSADPAAERMMERLMESSSVTPDDVAEQVFQAVHSGQFMVLTHKEGRKAARLKRLMPRLVDAQREKYWQRLRAKIERDG
ncbi:NADP-dependent 3-hydroxy acid dehydrogenase YdfG [Herbihabitans rhizosphaerae]|uniref:NADP-dependent 3-hydroxy acid dehydrogenase YdfG n=1 Tax=Herbihabitans rhizosphaerae TaxID=1872711 RepID=A0A4Q7KCP1_9PSEU|nr:SDR family oxidoreductase [Herbihabitans rhizosphaerae]RZS30405.1 NADP-dependent 3-hydroxy acid dehydrogenase YdfG [Herbihabitans rhizosphaerae]